MRPRGVLWDPGVNITYERGATSGLGRERLDLARPLPTSPRAERVAAASPKCEKAMWPLAAFSCARMSMRIARGPTRAAKGSVVHVWLLSPCIKNIDFFFRKVKNLKKKIRLRRYETPLAALAGMLYLYKYFRFLLLK